MAAAAPTPIVQPTRYQPPKVCIGQFVMWALEPPRMKPGEPALVTGIGNGTIDVTVFPRTARLPVPVSGVRHIADPIIPSLIHMPQGCWTFTERDKQVNQLLD